MVQSYPIDRILNFLQQPLKTITMLHMVVYSFEGKNTNIFYFIVYFAKIWKIIKNGSNGSNGLGNTS